MAKVHLDTIRDISLEEENGVVKTLKRTVTVTGLSGSDCGILYDALDASGVPTPGATLADDTNLILLKRSANFAGKNSDGSIVEVDLEYTSRNRYVVNTWKFEGSARMQSIRSQNDLFGNQILVAHTYSTNDHDPNLAGQFITKGGWIEVLEPHLVLRVSGDYMTNRPDIVSKAWISSVNSSPWVSGMAGTWLCTGVDFAEQNNSTIPPTWKFTMEFEHNRRGWQPAVVFIDSRTGEPPSGLVDGVGVKTVWWYPQAQFRQLFNIV